MQINNFKGSLIRFWRDDRGQDLAEYALMAGFVALAAGAIMPGVAESLRTIYTKIVASMEGTDPVAAVAAASKNADEMSLIRMACAVLAVLFLGLLVLRRKPGRAEE